MAKRTCPAARQAGIHPPSERLGWQGLQHSCRPRVELCRRISRAFWGWTVLKIHLSRNFCILNWIQTCQKFKDAQVWGSRSVMSLETLETHLLCKEKKRKQRLCRPRAFPPAELTGLGQIILVAGTNRRNLPLLLRYSFLCGALTPDRRQDLQAVSEPSSWKPRGCISGSQVLGGHLLEASFLHRASHLG